MLNNWDVEKQGMLWFKVFVKKNCGFMELRGCGTCHVMAVKRSLIVFITVRSCDVSFGSEYNRWIVGIKTLMMINRVIVVVPFQLVLLICSFFNHSFH
ncbi:hypothetical protein HanIR_Chr11g0527621 [Helianthus annuus]|nr:hypothetical protein HanIR_Chr11g0527621 [Helianthus annuus]